MLTGREKAAVFSPLAIYLLYVLFLAASPRPFLVRWLEACFGLFVALVFCNLIRRGYVEEEENDRPGEDGGDGPPLPRKGDQPGSSPSFRE